MSALAQIARGDAAVALAAARQGLVYARAREIGELARIAMDAARSAEAGGLARAEEKLRAIHALSDIAAEGGEA